MSKTISYKGTLDIGLQDRIRLKTLKGKVGARICAKTKFGLNILLIVIYWLLQLIAKLIHKIIH